MLMDVKEIREYLPHRYPFLLVDRVVELKEGESIVAFKNITINEAIFNGHFPEIPVFPGVLIIEAMAQAAGILGFKTMNKKPQDGSIYYFVGADDVRFKRPVVPGDQLRLEASILSENAASGSLLVAHWLMVSWLAKAPFYVLTAKCECLQ